MIKEETNVTGLPVVRNYKDRVFRMLFREKTELLTLYNAVNGTDYNNPEDLEVNTLDNAVYMSMKNDVSFLLDLRLSLYEQNLYSRRLIKLPTPKFIVFYNGMETLPERQILKLSDSYEVKEDEIALELTTLVLNINPGYNQDIFDRCPFCLLYTSPSPRD